MYGKCVIGWFRSIGKDRLVEGTWALGMIEINVGFIPASTQPEDVHQAVFALFTEAQLGWTRER